MRVLFILCAMTMAAISLNQAALAQSAAADSHNESHQEHHHSDKTAHTHECPMNPNITGFEGDRCPKCGMFLTPIKKDAQDTEHNHMQGHNGEHEQEKESGADAQDMSSPKEPPQENSTSHDNAVYICPMHPHITGEKGDTCPICGMYLTPKEQNTKGHSNHNGPDEDGAFMIAPKFQQALGVQTASVTRTDMARNIKGYGRAVANPRNEHAVTVRTEGWIVDLAVNAEGDAVKKGDLLFTYYSPDLMNAQADYLVGARRGGSTQRLRLYGMDENTIKDLKKRKKFFEETPFYAPANGTVSRLNTRQGAFVKQGGNIMTIQDYSTVWVMADIPQKDARFLKAGTKVKVNFPETGHSHHSRIDTIYPESDPQSRTAKIRIVLDNPDGHIKTESYADITFQAAPALRLSVPENAILYGKAGAYVFEDLGNGYYRPVMVDTGITSNGQTEIISGLTEGQKIVKSGQFMLDAESNLKGGMAQMEHSHDN